MTFPLSAALTPSAKSFETTWHVVETVHVSGLYAMSWCGLQLNPLTRKPASEVEQRLRCGRRACSTRFPKVATAEGGAAA